MSFTLYMTWVYQELHRRYKLWVPCKYISYPQLVHGFGQSSRDCSALPPNWRDGWCRPSIFPPSTCPIRYLFSTLRQFLGGLLLLVQPIFSEPPWGLWLKDLSNLIVTLGSLNLDIGSLRYSWHHFRPIQIHLAHQAPLQAHLDKFGPLGITLGPLRHLRFTQYTLSPL